jgi:beta-N-acetylhexosaminidase
LGVSLIAFPLFAAPKVEELTLREQVGQTVMPRMLVGKQKAFKKAVLNGEVTGFFIKTEEGVLHTPKITPKNQKKYIAKQRKALEKTIADLQKWASKSRHKIPLLLSLDYEGGTVTSPMFLGLKQMPANMLLGAGGSEKIVADVYAAQALEMKNLGVFMALGPATDVNSNPKNPIIQTRSFGDNAQTVGRLAAVAVRALEQNGVSAVSKHFPGHGDTSSDSHYVQPVTDLPKEELWQKHISAFVPSVKAGVSGVLSAHVVYPSLDKNNTASFSPTILKGLLRKEMGYDGVIITDGLDMGSVSNHSVEELVRLSYKAGNNMLLLSGDIRDTRTAKKYPRRAADYVEEVVAAVEEGRLSAEENVTRQEIEISAKKILALKEKFGLFKKPEPPVLETGFDAASRSAAEAGVTLVRSAENVLPVTDKEKDVCAVFFADGIFSLQLKAFTDYLTARGKRARLVHSSVSPTQEERKQAGECMRGAHVIVVGTSYKTSLDEDQRRLVEEIRLAADKSDKKFVQISLLNPYEIPHYPHAQTILAVYGPTEYTMETSAKILLGDLQPKGKLPVSLN